MNEKQFLAFGLFYCLGALTQIPSNFFVVANGYWMYKFRDPNINSTDYITTKTPLQTQFTAAFSIVSTIGTIIFFVLTIIFGHLVSINKRIIGCLSSMAVMMAVTIMFVKINTDSWQKGFFVTTMITAVIISALTATFMMTTILMANRFPPRYLGSLLSGQSICGMLSAILQILSLATNAEQDITAFIFFSIGFAFMLFTLFYYLYVARTSIFFKQHIAQSLVPQEHASKPTFNQVKTILNKTKYLMMTMVITVGSTIMIHPALTSLIVPVNQDETGTKWNQVFFIPVITYFLYYLTEFIGRELAAKVKQPQNPIVTVLIAICRIGLIPLLMLCNIQPRHHLPVAFNNDYMYIIFIIIFGLSNGYLMNLSVIELPYLTTKDERDTAVMIIILCMMAGLGLCSFFSIALLSAI